MIYDFNIGKGKIERDKINYILSYLHEGQYTSFKSTNGYVPINQETLKKVLNEGGLNILKKLVKENYIICDGSYKMNIKSLSYKINYDKVSKKGLKTTKDNRYYHKTIKMINDKNGELDHITKYIIEMTQMFFNQGKIGFGNNIDKVNKILKRYRNENLDRYNSQRILVDRIQSGDLTTVSDKQGARIYSNYSNLSSEIRKYLQINNEEKICIDISNSQVQTLCLVLMEQYKVLDDKFYKLVFSGEIYEYFMKYSGRYRNEVKKNFLNWMYAENIVSKSKKDIQYVENIFKTHFKEVYDIITEIKGTKNGGSKLACKLQMMESKIIKGIQYDLLRKGITVISLHDSIYIQDNIKNSRELVIEIRNKLVSKGYSGIKVERDGIKLNESKRFIKEIIDNGKIQQSNRKKQQQILDEIHIYNKKEVDSYHMIPNLINNETNIKIKDKEKEYNIRNIDDYLNNYYENNKYYKKDIKDSKI